MTKNLGKVYLVGAGPGDPGLITQRGLECLRRADEVLYDYLVDPRILAYLTKSQRAVCLGRHGGTRIWSQAEINEKIVALARQGKTIVRLKNGDPAVFARGAEEVEALISAEIPFEIVPGVTAALAAGSYAGIPVTHRDIASAVALVTGQERDGKSETALDYAALAVFPGTLVMYMGVTTAPRWTAELIAAGKPADTPAAIVRRCSCPDQSTVHCTLGEVKQTLAEGRVRPPVIVILGEVTRLAKRMSWFEQRPLFGRRVMVTRPEHQAGGLSDKLEELGASVDLQPAIQIDPPVDWAPVDDALQRLAEFDWLVFSSANGVRFLIDRLWELGLDMRALSGIRIAAIGPGTSEELKHRRLRTDLQPATFRAESLAEELSRDALGKRFLLARASRGREVLAEQLTAVEGIVEQIVVYQSGDTPAADPDVVERLAAGQIDYVTVTSSAIARSLARLFGDRIRASRLVSISPVTSATLRQLGLEPAVEASCYTMQGVVDALLADAQR